MPHDKGVTLSFKVNAPLGVEAIQPLVSQEGAWYNAIYRYEKRGDQWWAVLTRVEEIMPAATPQVRRHDDQARVHMMHEDGSFDFTAEAEQRRKEWAELNHVPA